MWFKIGYTHPDTQEKITEKKEFLPSVDPVITAEEWAEDYAYSRADKGPHKVTILRKKP